MPKADSSRSENVHAVLLADVEGYSNLQTVMVEQLLLTTFREMRVFIRKCFGRFTPYINTWGDGIALIARDPIKVAMISINFRNCFLESRGVMREDRSVNLRIALDCGVLATWKSGLTGSREYAGTPLIAAARLESIVPPSEVWATDRFVLAAGQDDLRRRKILLQSFGRVPLPKGEGEVEVFRLFRSGEKEWKPDVVTEVHHHMIAGGHLADHARKSVTAMRLPIQHEEEEEYTSAFRRAVQVLHRGDHVSCLCGDKNWDNPLVIDYMNDFIIAALVRGVMVRRAYFEPKGGFSPREQAVIAAHASWSRCDGVPLAVRIVPHRKATELRSRFSLPRGFGLVLPHRSDPQTSLDSDWHTVMFHYGFRTGQAKARMFNDQGLLAFYTNVFETAWRMGQNVTEDALKRYVHSPDAAVLRQMTCPRELLAVQEPTLGAAANPPLRRRRGGGGAVRRR